ncbi:MAG: acyl-CoA thioesterase [Bacteroidia bacterium]|nr:acyl-CoA thioesterase [Bacteroidia bacterium]
MRTKKIADTFVSRTELVLPNDTNTLGNLMGGKLLHWMDIITAISAQKCSNRIVVTVSVDFVEFKSPIKLGEVVILESKVTRCFTSSMEVKVDVWAENLQTEEKRKSNSAYYTFVAVDQSGNPIPVNQVEPESDEEKELYQSAMTRRELRMILSGRMQPSEAGNWRKIFGI